MSEIAVEVNHVWKKFHRGELHDSLRDFVPALAKRLVGRGPRRDELADDDFWALQDVSFQVRRGEVLGIIGPNGAGKSTMLKILARILKPNRGRVRVAGRLRALIEIAAGFHGDLTGRENVYLNGAILGMKKREIDAKFDQIVEFSGIGEFLDTPVKRYSSGMYARLGFAVAAHLEPEILLVDEILSVGDREFQNRCLKRMETISGSGVAVVFVSHNLAAVQGFCTRGILLRNGAIAREGAIEEVLAEYVQSHTQDSSAVVDLRGHPARRRDSRPILESVSMRVGDAAPSNALQVGDPLTLELAGSTSSPLRQPVFGIGVDDMFGRRVFTVSTAHCAELLPELNGRFKICCRLDEIRLTPGRYVLSISAGAGTEHQLDNLDRVVELEVIASDYYKTGHVPRSGLGVVVQPSNWSLCDPTS